MKKSQVFSALALIVCLTIVGAGFQLIGGPTSLSPLTWVEERPDSLTLRLGERLSPRRFLDGLRAGFRMFSFSPMGLQGSEEDVVESTSSFVEVTDSPATPKEDSDVENDSTSSEVSGDTQGLPASRRGYGPRPTTVSGSTSAVGGFAQSGGAAFENSNPITSGPQGIDFLETDDTDSADGWVELLKRERSYRTLNKFISTFQSGDMSSEVFYSVTRALVADGDPILMEYGIVALSSTPYSESFLHLIESRELIGFSARIEALIHQGLRTYTEPSNLPALFIVLQSPEPTPEFFKAIELAEASVRRWLAPSNQATVDQGEEDPSMNFRGVYEQLYTILLRSRELASHDEVQRSVDNVIGQMGGAPSSSGDLASQLGATF